MLPMFWKLSDDYKFDADWDKGVELEKIICPINPGHQRAGPRITDLKVVLPKRKVPDIFWVNDCIIQDRTLRLFREAGLTGFDVRPVEARFKNSSDEPPTLWELRVTGWGGVAPPESGIRLIKNCRACGHLVYSGCTNRDALIDVSQWDGSDFFFVWPLPKYIFVSQRAAQVISENGLTGLTMQRLNELREIRGAGPGRLHYWLPEARAHELGDALGIY